MENVLSTRKARDEGSLYIVPLGTECQMGCAPCRTVYSYFALHLQVIFCILIIAVEQLNIFEANCRRVR